jgi:hypothetical protein
MGFSQKCGSNVDPIGAVLMVKKQNWNAVSKNWIEKTPTRTTSDCSENKS